MLDARVRFAKAQAELVSALLGKASVPAGFDASRLHAAGVALATKRMREAAQAWPDLSRDLGERFTELFAAYAAVTPYPSCGGPLADGRSFIRYLQARMELPPAARLEAMRVDLFFVRQRDGLVPRHGPVLRAALLSHPRRLILAWRLPWLGAHWLCIPLNKSGYPI